MPSQSKKVTQKQSTKQATKKTDPKKSVVKKGALVKMPSNMPVRAREKVSLLKHDLNEYLRVSGLYVAYTTGVCFILVGAALLLAYSQHNNQVYHQLANVINSTDDTTQLHTNIIDNSIIKEPTDNPEPRFDIRTKIPDLLESDLVVEFLAEHTKSIAVTLRHIETNNLQKLQHSEIKTNIFTTKIPVSNLNPGTYQLTFILRDIDTDTPHAFKSTRFIIPAEEIVMVDNAVTIEPVNESTIEETIDIADNVTDDTLLETKDDSNLAHNEDIGSENEQVNLTEKTTELEDEVNNAVPGIPEVQKKFELQEPVNENITNRMTFILHLPDELTGAHLYARPTNGLQSQFLAKAIKGADNWYVHFDSNNLPNREYEFFAISTYNNQNIQTNSVILKVTNVVESAQILTENREVTSQLPNDVDLNIQTETLLTTEKREFSKPVFATTTIKDSVARETEQILQTEQAEFQDLLQRYAAAIQAGDQTVINIIEQAIENKQTILSQRTLEDTRTTDIADNVSAELAKRIEDAKNRVALFEQIRNERTKGVVAKDSDGDGISDLDERLLYKTDPYSADTDNDGVTDGVEIAGGYDPTSDVPETIITYESPKETFGVVREDVLRVHSVDAAVTFENINNNEHSIAQVSAVIRGKALPNSFVTLHIFSTPTVVTVRTDADGDFEYTFDKELADGTHEVYVAMTDNAGRIVAQSNPFTFVKEAQAFTPVDAASESVAPLTVVNSNDVSSYNVTIGLSVLSFGLILLMLGFTLRRQPEPAKIANEITTS